MIMGEAFSDLSENTHLDFTGYRDPMKNWKEICAEEGTISGHIVVPNFGGGTSNTEYDVLTGCATRYLGSSLPSYTALSTAILTACPSAAKVTWLRNAFHSLAMHGFITARMYILIWGLQPLIFRGIPSTLTQGYGGYVNEMATMDKIIETLDTHIKETDTPLFSFTVTIQNHGPYEKKYGTLEQNFSSDIELNETQTDLLTQYFQGIGDADEQIGRLKEYAEGSDEPIVLVYFGDHLPGFSNGMEFFDLLDYPIDANGSPEEQLAVYETPYLIWQNESAKALENTKTAAEISNTKPEDVDSSARSSSALLCWS